MTQDMAPYIRRPRFVGTPQVHWLPDGRLQLDAPLYYISRDGREFRIPAGFDTDLASVPRLVPGVVRVFFRGELKTAWAAILHDRLYQTREVTRMQADALFFEALRFTGETRFGAWCMWLGVRAGGWYAWNDHQRDE